MLIFPHNVALFWVLILIASCSAVCESFVIFNHANFLASVRHCTISRIERAMRKLATLYLYNTISGSEMRYKNSDIIFI